MMRWIRIWLFGIIAPSVEVCLVIVGLAVLGWEGFWYTLRGHWMIIRVANAGFPPYAGHPWQNWLSAQPLSGVCIVIAIVLFFILPHSYSQD